MSSSPPPGLLGNVVLGYAVAWRDRRPLFAVLLPVVAVLLLATALLDLLLGADRLVIVDGIVRPGEADVLAWAKLATAVLLWLLGLTAGTAALTGGRGTIGAFRRAATYLPVFVIGLLAAGVGLFVALWAVAGLATGWFGVAVVFGVLAAGALMSALILLTGLTRVAGAADRMPTWVEAGSFVLGGIVVPLLLSSVLGRVPYVEALLQAVVILVALAAQVGVAVRPLVPETMPSRPARLWPGAVLITVAVGISISLVVVNPHQVPSVRTNDGRPSGPVAVAWPAGQHPVIVTDAGVWFCDDDLCESFTDVNGGPSAFGGYATAGIGADGTVVKTAVTGGPDNGGPFVHYATCVRSGCREAWLPVRASAREKLDQEARVEVAGAAAPDGALWIFVAAPVQGGEHGRYRFSLIRCAQFGCAAPQRHELGIADRTPEDGYQDGRRARLSIGADGRPVASFWIGWSVYRFSCEPGTCAKPQRATQEAAPPDAVWETVGDRTVAFRAGQLYDGADSALISTDVAAQPGGLATVGQQVYVAGAQPSAPDSGFRVSVGEAAQHWRQTVWRCTGFDCVSSPLDVYEGEARDALLAVADDGRVLVVRYDRIVLLQTPIG
ncbi:hypothetical protein OHA21_21045 [Actinoplanes sp. NBC_00393]|uniref:hypothetical protein n=1 Tax=Actinoplanes sp. NBC_00393 TaxID=2975953 RepID=UPI002E2506A1